MKDAVQLLSRRFLFLLIVLGIAAFVLSGKSLASPDLWLNLSAGFLTSAFVYYALDMVLKRRQKQLDYSLKLMNHIQYLRENYAQRDRVRILLSNDLQRIDRLHNYRENTPKLANQRRILGLQVAIAKTTERLDHEYMVLHAEAITIVRRIHKYAALLGEQSANEWSKLYNQMKVDYEYLKNKVAAALRALEDLERSEAELGPEEDYSFTDTDDDLNRMQMETKELQRETEKLRAEYSSLALERLHLEAEQASLKIQERRLLAEKARLTEKLNLLLVQEANLGSENQDS